MLHRFRLKILTDHGLLHRGVANVGAMSPDEFTEFYAASFRRLVGQLYAMTGDGAEAQDAVQEAFVRAWANRSKLDASASPDAWVRATAWRIAVSRWHRARRGRLLARLQPPPPAAAR
jgi:RNA polymerase sigma-70 factor, ECF subfamily